VFSLHVLSLSLSLLLVAVLPSSPAQTRTGWQAEPALGVAGSRP